MNEQIPDLYCDAMQINLSPFDVVFQFSQRSPSPGTSQAPTVVGHIRMSLEHAKVMAIILKRVLKQHEEAQGHEIVLHPQVYAQSGISKQEDW